MKLLQHVVKIRSLIERALTNRFDRMGVKADGQTAIDSLPAERQEVRRRIDNIINSHRSSAKDYAEARRETIGECVFTLFNRIAAIKVMEARELFPEVVRRRTENAGRSFAHNAWLEDHPEERSAEREGLKHFFSWEFDQLGQRLPIFRSSYPYSMLPTADELFQIVEAFNAIDLDPDCGEATWQGDDILGWMYENYNSAEKAELKASGEKTEYDKVSLQSQVYTPRWVVKFLVDNTLGKLYLEMFPDSTLRNDYAIANVPQPSPFPVSGRTRKRIEDIKVIDPACGSGNFLLYASQLLYAIYENQIDQYGAEYSRRDIPKLILENNLFGIDLDERAVQLTQLSLYIKAWQLGGHRAKDRLPQHVNVVCCNVELPEYSEVEAAFLLGGNWDTLQQSTISSVWNDLRSARKFGSLIRVEEKFDALLPIDATDMYKEQWKEEMFDFKNQMITTLRNQVHQWSGEGSNEYSMSRVSDAITFLDILTTKFDVAVANPPYTDSADFGEELKTFVNDNYSKPLKFNSNLYAAFIKRCCELTDEDGKVGMIHPHTFMFIKTFEGVRKFMIEQTHINVMVDYGLDRVNLFGPGILLDATFYTLDKGKINANEDGLYFNITANQQEKFKKESLGQAYSDALNGTPNKHVYRLPQSKLKGIKSYPFIYWISDEFREKFGEESVDSGNMKVVKGLTTSDNNRFLRFWWEIPSDKISNDYNTDKKKWVRYVKGGPYNKWYGNMWCLLNWENDGYEIKHFVDEKGKLKSRPQNIAFYFREGITYSAAGSKGATFRYLPANYIIDAGGPGIYPDKYKNIEYALAFFNSKLTFYICDCLNPTVNINQGDLWRVPFVKPQKEDEDKVTLLAKSCISIKKHLCSYSIIEQNFKSSPITTDCSPKESLSRYYNYENGLLTQVLINEAIINETVFDIYQLSDHDRQMVLDKEGKPVGSLPVSVRAKAEYKAWMAENTEFAPTTELNEYVNNLPESDEQPTIDDFSTLYQNNNGWEEFCIKHQVNPIEAWLQFKEQGLLPPQRTQTMAFELLTDVIRSVLEKDDDGVVPIIERVGEEQLALRIEGEMVGRGYSAAQIAQVFALLGMPLDKYLMDRFFQQLSDHLNLFMYLPKTPFIWHLSSGSHHALELYVSIYRWSRDTLFSLKSQYAANREDALRDRLSALEQKDDASAKMEAEEVREQLHELHSFCEKVDSLLATGYDPKLDDGVGKNIAPLQQRQMLSYEVLNDKQMKKYLNADW